MMAMVRICSFIGGLFIKPKKVDEVMEKAKYRNLEQDKIDQAEAGSIESKLVTAEAMLLQNWAKYIAAKLMEQSKD